MFNFGLFVSITAILIASTNQIFCSAYCKPNSCTGILSTQCTACDALFTHQTNNTCTIDPSSGYAMFEDENQITALPSWGTTCGTYNINGAYGPSDNPAFRSNSVISTPHYAVRMIAWVILYNEWDAVNDNITGTLNTSSETKTQLVSTYSNS